MYNTIKEARQKRHEEHIRSLEANYRLYYDTLRKDLDILLASTIPTQKNLMKTILWINFTFVGIVGVWTRYDHSDILVLLSVCIAILSSLSIVMILWSLTQGRAKTFGQPDIDAISGIDHDEYMRLNAIYAMISSVSQAFDANTDSVVRPRAKMIASSTKMTIATTVLVVLFVLAGSVNLTKGGTHMAEDKTPPPPSSVTANPNKSIITNSDKPAEQKPAQPKDKS